MTAFAIDLRPPTSAPRGDVTPLAFGAGSSFLAVPFDAMRFHYAAAVMSGLTARSIVASGRLERTLDVLEKLILGPLARQR